MSGAPQWGGWLRGVEPRLGRGPRLCRPPTLLGSAAADSHPQSPRPPWPAPNARRYLVRDFTDGTAAMAFVTEAMGDFGQGTVQPTNDHFEHLTCFVGGMLVLGEAPRYPPDQGRCKGEVKGFEGV